MNEERQYRVVTLLIGYDPQEASDPVEWDWDSVLEEDVQVLSSADQIYRPLVWDMQEKTHEVS